MSVEDARLRARTEEVVEFAAEHGWEAYTASAGEGEVEGCGEVAMVGGFWPLRDDPKGRGFLFTLAFGVNEATGRVVTLEHDGYPGHAKVVLTLDGDERGRYWYSRTASSWREALADPLDWCKFDPSD